MLREFHFEQRSHLLTALTAECQDILAESLSKHGAATLLVSGGSTPAPLYEQLSKTELAWKKVKIALVDERWVDPQNPASNEGLIKRHLLINNAKAASFTGMKTSTERASRGHAETESNYQNLPQPFSAAIIGMGPDGHTASLFPQAEGLNKALKAETDQLTAAINAKNSPVAGAHTERMTMTVSGLLKCERLILLITGEDKLAVFDQAMKPGPIEEMPIRALLHQERTPVEMYWAP